MGKLDSLRWELGNPGSFLLVCKAQATPTVSSLISIARPLLEGF